MLSLLALVSGIALVAGMFQAPLALSEEVGELRARQGRLAGRIAAFPGLSPSAEALAGLAAETRTLVAPIEQLEHPNAATAADHARRLAHLAGQAARTRYAGGSVRLNEIRQTEAALAGTLAAIQRDADRARGRWAWVAGGGLAGMLLLVSSRQSRCISCAAGWRAR